MAKSFGRIGRCFSEVGFKNGPGLIRILLDLFYQFFGTFEFFFITDPVNKKDIQIFPVNIIIKIENVNLYGKLFINPIFKTPR
jgi:hypothetical protein